MKTSILVVLALSTLIFCACTQNMNVEDENKAVMRNWFEEGWNQHNPNVIDDFFAPSFFMHGLDVDLADWKVFVATNIKAFPDINFTVEDLIAEGDKVIVRWSYRGTHQGESMGIPATGKQVTVTGMNIARFADGKIIEDWGNWDALGLLQQLGAVPPLGEE
jgi:steroid delta-isomerase-like uncharacterized protein